MKKSKKYFCVSAAVLAAFALWTLAVVKVDVQTIGPQGSAVGFAALNGTVRDALGSNMLLYTLTDLLSLVPFGFVFGFALEGLWQLLKRKSIFAVERSILVLGGFYAVVFFVYILFEIIAVNYRPVLIGGKLEASYPSSTAMLALCVMITSVMQIRPRIKNKTAGRYFAASMAVFTAFMVIGRVLSGVHWITDIIGGVLLSAGLVFAYLGAVSATEKG